MTRRIPIVLTLLLSLWAPLTSAQAFVISDIRVEGLQRISAGSVFAALPVAVGDTVEPGDTLIVIEAMKMEHAIVAQVSGSVSEILFAVGDQVDEGDTLVLLEVE